MLLYQALQAWWNGNETNRTNHRRLTSRKAGVGKNESLSELFGSRWASKVKINAYYKTMKVFFDLACMSNCCSGLKKKIKKNEHFITHNRGTLMHNVEAKNHPTTSTLKSFNAQLAMHYTNVICQHWKVKSVNDICSAIFDLKRKNDG